MKPRIDGIIWDLGNIFLRVDHSKECKAFAEYSQFDPKQIFQKLFSEDNAPAVLHEAGKISSQEFFRLTQKLLNFSGDLAFEKFCSIWTDIFEENKGVDAIIARIRPDVRQCALSNTDPIHWSVLERWPVFKQFVLNPKTLVRSYTSHARKPDPKIYRDAFEALSMTEKEIGYILYIDDVAEYREAFKSWGGNVLAYDCTKDDLSVLEKGLMEFDVLSR